MHWKNIRSWKYRLKAADGFSLWAQDQWIWIPLKWVKSWENKSKEKNSTGHRIFNIPVTNILLVRKASLHMKKQTCLPCTSKLEINWVIESLTLSFPSLYWFQICVPLSSVPYHGICQCPISEQHSTLNDPMASRCYVGSSPLLLDRPPRYEPCREHCCILVQASSVWRETTQGAKLQEPEKIARYSVNPFTHHITLASD